MTNMTATEAVQAFLTPIKEATEIRDVGGNLLGYFTPANRGEDLLYQQDIAQFDLEELKRRAASKERGLTTEEVLHHLRSLEHPG
ncbi:MAG TPA: hypothetical protein VN688_30985 [Gemmataceae bacterium]|nr:hypothetical protein [Gemmataceae bacterium]